MNNKYDVVNNDRFVSLAVAPKLSIKGKYTLSPSVDAILSSLQSTITYFHTDSSQKKMELNNLDLQSRIGILFNTSKFYIGYSILLLHRRKNLHANSYLNIKGSYYSFLQAGYTFQRNTDSKFSFTPQLAVYIVNYPGSSRIIIGVEAINLNFRYKQFIWGVNNQGIHLGWQTVRFRVMATNNIGGSNDRFTYVGNLSFRYIFNSKNQQVGRPW